MLEIKREIVSLEPEDVMELERIITDRDQGSAYKFLKKKIYQRMEISQRKCGCSCSDSCCSGK